MRDPTVPPQPILELIHSVNDFIESIRASRVAMVFIGLPSPIAPTWTNNGQYDVFANP